MDIKDEIRNKLLEFKDLNIGTFAYCESYKDYELAGTMSGLFDPVKICLEITKDSLKYKKEHRRLSILDSYLEELTEVCRITTTIRPINKNGI